MNLSALAAVLTFHVPTGTLQEQLGALSNTADVDNFIYVHNYPITDPTIRPGFDGDMTLQDALSRIVADTGYTIEFRGTGYEAILHEPIGPDETPPFFIDGQPYACTPTAWVSGIVFTRLGLFLWNVGAFESEYYCTPRPGGAAVNGTTESTILEVPIHAHSHPSSRRDGHDRKRRYTYGPRS